MLIIQFSSPKIQKKIETDVHYTAATKYDMKNYIFIFVIYRRGFTAIATLQTQNNARVTKLPKTTLLLDALILTC